MDFDSSGVSVMADWMDGEVDIPEQTLTNAQVFALLRMTEMIRRPEIARTIGSIKDGLDCHLRTGKDSFLEFPAECWSELAEDEQTALWVAPKFGGIFTTEERKIIKGGFK